MTLPDPGKYIEVIQNPQFCFKDPDLKNGTLETNKLGLPRVISGQNALVFKLISPSKQVYAIRCFLTYKPDQKERYQKISDYLGKCNLKYAVGFKFIEEGIKVQNTWYPILKMDWVDGQPLDDYLNNNFNNQRQILQLTYRFLEMLKTIRKENIAHCDLQHGNILVVGNELKLVDYDGMFIPDFAGKESQEFGHPNYQHPSRVFQRFDGNMDNFSAWVIFSSLAVIATDPKIWKVNEYDNQLLFNGKDFLYPDDSPIIKILKNHSHPTIMKFGKLMNSLMVSPELLPSPIDYSLPPLTSDNSWIENYVDTLLNYKAYLGGRDSTAEAVEPPWYVEYIRKGITEGEPWYMEHYKAGEISTSAEIKPDISSAAYGGCSYCGKKEYLPFKCNYCGGLFCGDHRMPFNHDCPGIERWERRNVRF